VVYANVSDYKLIQLLQNYSNLYTFLDAEYKDMRKENIEEKISEYRGVNNEKPCHKEFFPHNKIKCIILFLIDFTIKIFSK
jgi:hypothetical protein